MSLFHFHCDVINNGKVTLDDYDVIICAIDRFWKITPHLLSEYHNTDTIYFKLDFHIWMLDYL